eukprot:TRINITY_DN3850_c0_g1_i1.p1 TRINITY_DN3850_c0_g1~~TRINITY_DN3850_c0_g1_i1.p1  ORF type:complete len:956 (-),score=241.60 TRINITY_DN3850_c0_g1_i1:101-2968(-)
MIKPLLDNRSYKLITLENKLEVMLISDGDINLSAASMDIKIGSFFDPVDIQGLAHFLEHMLFMGTTKYPDENEYSEYLSKHGGDSNAFTDLENTNYYFDVNCDSFEGALDRFAQFFISPLFNESSTEREMKAVDSEHSNNLQNDGCRINQIEMSSASEGHVYSRFNTGNISTLSTNPKEKGLDVRKSLIEFYEKYYSSNIMKLAIIGKESIETLEKWVKEKFSDIKNKNVKDNLRTDPFPYGPNELKKVFYVIPVQEKIELKLVFQLPPQSESYKEKSLEYLQSLFTHDGEGSISYYLKEEGLATQVTFSNVEYNFVNLFEICVELTEDALEDIWEIPSCIFSYINMLKGDNVVEWHYKELKQIYETKFKYKEKEEGSDVVVDLAMKMQSEFIPRHLLLKEWALYENFDKQKILNLLNTYFIPDNLRVLISSKTFQKDADQTEEWYKTSFKVEEISKDNFEDLLNPDDASEYDPPLHLPSHNPFLPENFDLKHNEENLRACTIIHDTKYCRVWHKQDNTFKVPKGFIDLHFDSPVAYSSPRDSMKTLLFCEILNHKLSTKLCHAIQAEFCYDVFNTTSGFYVGASGFNDKLEKVLFEILNAALNLEIKEDDFDMLKEKVVRDYKNVLYDDPKSNSQYHITLALLYPKFSIYEYIELSESVTLEEVQIHCKKLFDTIYYESLIYGNFTKEEALKINEEIEKLLPMFPPTKPAYKRVVKLKKKTNYLYSAKTHSDKETNSATSIYLQVGQDEINKYITMDLFSNMVQANFFDQLRTKEQLGYSVSSSKNWDSNVVGMYFNVQSSVALPEYLDYRIETWIESLDTYLKEMEEKTFNDYRTSLIKYKTEKFKNLDDEYNHFNIEISCRTYEFERRFEEAKILEKITKEDVILFYNQYIRKDSPNRRKISSWMRASVEPPSSSEEEENKLVVDPSYKDQFVQFYDFHLFKSKHQLFSNTK